MTLTSASEGPQDGAASPHPPAGLGVAGTALWRSIADVYELRADELRALEDASREADLIARLEDELRGADYVVRGSQGQPVAHPMIGELRAHRSTLSTLLRSLNLAAADGDDSVRTASEAGRRAARARWDRRGANRGA